MQEVSKSTFPRIRRWLTLFLCLVECLFFGATITGWASILYVFKEDGVFSHLCHEEFHPNSSDFNESLLVTMVTSINSTNGSVYPAKDATFLRCSAQDKMFSLIFTVAILIWGVIGIPLGWFFDKYGILKTKFIAVTCGITGFLMFAWAGSDSLTCYLLFPGSIFLVICHCSTIVTCTHMAGLAGAHASMAIAIFCGAGNSSIVVFLVVKILQNMAISRHISLSFVAAVWILVLLYSLFITPRFKVVASSSSDSAKSFDVKNDRISPDINDSGISVISFKINSDFGESFDSIADTKLQELESNANEANDTTSILACIKTANFLCHLMWFSFIHLAYFSFIGAYNPWVTNLVNKNDDKVNHLVNVLAYCQLSSILISLLPGSITDFVRSKISDYGGMAPNLATVPSLVFCAVMAIVIHVCVILDRLWAVYVSAFVSEVARSFLFSTALTFISLTFPGEHYGKLFGLSYFMNGVVNLLQYPLFIWADSSNTYLWMSVVLLIVATVAFIHPIYLVISNITGSRKKVT